MTDSSSQPPERIIRPRKGLIGIDFHELWRYRELFGFLTWRDIMVRYKQTAIGVLWALLQPLLTLLIFSMIFSGLTSIDTGGAAYPMMFFPGLLAWTFFANALQSGSQSVLASSQMISKIYFPRLIIPASATLGGMVDFLIAFLMMLGLMVYYDTAFRLEMLALPIFFLLAFASAFGASLWLSAMNVKYRDIKHIVPFIVRMGMFVSPVAWPTLLIPERWRLLYCLNPVVAPIDGFRWAVLGNGYLNEEGIALYSIWWPGFALSAAVGVILLVSGLFYFRYFERNFADVI